MEVGSLLVSINLDNYSSCGEANKLILHIVSSLSYTISFVYDRMPFQYTQMALCRIQDI